MKMTSSINRDQPTDVDPVSRRERGFAMPVVLFVLVALSVGAIFFVSGSADERLMGRAMRESGRAFYATEAGLNNVVAAWSVAQYDTLLTTSGDTVDLGWTQLDGASEYHTFIRRTDGGSGTMLFSLRVTGRGTQEDGGQSMRYMTLKTTPADLDIRAAIKGGSERFEADKSGAASGIDTNPAGWAAYCAALEDKAGVTWHHPDSTEVKDSAYTIGNPPMEYDESINLGNIFEWGEFNYDDVVAMADIVVPSANAAAGQIKPHYSGSACNLVPWKNWGDREDPGALCGDYFPVIYRPGDLTIRNGKGGGQGILIVDGDLRIEDDFEFTGIIIVKGEVRLEDNVLVHGAIISGDRTRLTDGVPFVQYSSCAVDRALLGAGLYRIRPISSRGWRQGI